VYPAVDEDRHRRVGHSLRQRDVFRRTRHFLCAFRVGRLGTPELRLVAQQPPEGPVDLPFGQLALV